MAVHGLASVALGRCTGGPVVLARLAALCGGVHRVFTWTPGVHGLASALGQGLAWRRRPMRGGFEAAHGWHEFLGAQVFDKPLASELDRKKAHAQH